jgi:hypothetical protein
MLKTGIMMQKSKEVGERYSSLGFTQRVLKYFLKSRHFAKPKYFAEAQNSSPQS